LRPDLRYKNIKAFLNSININNLNGAIFTENIMTEHVTCSRYQDCSLQATTMEENRMFGKGSIAYISKIKSKIHQEPGCDK
jgi:hypothetical protein